MSPCFALIALAAVLQAPHREIAITFDDLPVISVTGADVAAQQRITNNLLAAVAKHRVPAIGFVNEGKLRSPGSARVDEKRVAMLRQWVGAGLELGNHSFSHFDLHTTSVATYESDIARGDSVTRSLLAAGRRPPPRWFRHPMLHTGRDTATRNRVDRFLAKLDYRVAPVTIDNNEFIFAAAYERLLLKRDSATARRLRQDYLSYMTAIVEYYERQSVALTGREIRQVLLLHANQLNGDAFDALATMLEGRGYSFIPLARAVDDPAYRMADNYDGPGGITWIHRWALTLGKRGSFFAGEPVVPAYVERASQPDKKQ